MAESFRTTTGAALAGELALDDVLAQIELEDAMKGMFFARHVAALGAAYAEVLGELRAPPTNGKYHAFESYPLGDYMRLFDRVARARLPGAPREAYRLVARGELDVFSESTLGKVTLALLREPGAALLRYPEAFDILGRGPRATAERRADDRVTVSLSRPFGAAEYVVGVLEGIVIAFDADPQLEVTLQDDGAMTVDVSWDGSGVAESPRSSRR